MANSGHTDLKKHELEEIDGIGPAIRKALVKGGKKTRTDLANSTVAEIEALLENADVSKLAWSRAKIEVMIQEAQRQDLEFNVLFERGYEHGQQTWRAHINPPGDDTINPEWQTDGAYTVKFKPKNAKEWQTFVEDETGSSKNVTGWSPDKWWAWIAEKESLTQRSAMSNSEDTGKETAADQQAGSAEDAKSSVEITRFEIDQPDRNQETLRAYVDFEISDKIIKQRTPLQYQVVIFVVNLNGNESYLAGFESKTLDTQPHPLESRITFPMPELGRFQPHCFVLLLPSRDAHDYRRGKIYSVTPPR